MENGNGLQPAREIPVNVAQDDLENRWDVVLGLGKGALEGAEIQLRLLALVFFWAQILVIIGTLYSVVIITYLPHTYIHYSNYVLGIF